MSRPELTRILASSIAAFLGSFGLAPSANAQTPYTWSTTVTGAGPHSWLVDANWSGTGYPGNVAGAPGAAGDSASLAVNWTAASTIELNAEITLGSLALNDTGAAPDVSITLAAGAGGSLVFDAPAGNATFTNGSESGANNISAPVTLVDSLAITANNSFIISGAASGAGALIKGGGNNMTLSNDGNAFSGGVMLNSGGLFVHAAGALGTGTLVISGGTIANNQASTNVAVSTANLQSWNGNFAFGGQSSLDLGAGTVTLNGSRSIAIGSTGDTLTIGGAISGPSGASLTTTNVTAGTATGILVLGGANTYDGGTLINGGVVRFANSSAIPASGAITVQAGGALSVSGAHTTLAGWMGESRLSTISSGALALTGDNVEDFAPATSGFQTLGLGAELNSSFAYTGTYTPGTNGYFVGGGGGTLTLPNANALTGLNNLTVGNGGGGTVILSGNNDFSGQTTIAAGATLQLGAGDIGGMLTGTSAITNNGTLLLNRSDASSFSAPFLGSGILGLRGTGEVTLSNAATTQGGINQAVAGSNVLNVANLTLTGGIGGNAIIVGNQTPNGSFTSLAIRPANGAGTGALTVNSAANDIFVGQNGANNGNNPPPTAVLDLSDLASFSATINEFRIATAGRSIGQVTLATGSNTITADNLFLGTQVTNGTSGSFLRLGQINTLNVNAIAISGGRTSATLEFAPGLPGTPSVTIRGKAGGTSRANLVIADQQNASNGVGGNNGGSSDPVGIVDFTAGSVDALLNSLLIGVGGSEASSSIGAGRGTLSFDEGTIDATTVVVGRANLATAGGNQSNDSAQGTLNVSGTASLVAGSLHIAQNNDTNGAANPGAIGTLNLSGGAIAVTGDLVAASHSTSSPLAATATMTISGGTLNVGGNFIAATHTGGEATGTRAATINLTGGVTTIAGNLTEGGGTTASNTSTVTLNGGTLDLTGGNLYVDTFNAQSGTLQNVAQLGTATGNGTGTAAPLTKTGNGTLILAGTNTYTGQTNVTAGTLLVNGSITGAVVVSNAGSALGGSGSIAGSATLGAGTVLAPGASPGVLTIAGATDLGANTTFAIELNGDVAGLGYDQLVTGGITIDASSQITLSLGYAAELNEVLTIIDNTSAVAIGGVFANLADGGTIDATFGGGTWTFTADYDGGTGNDLTLTVSTIPEPSTAFSLLGGLAALLSLQRFRRKTSGRNA